MTKAEIRAEIKRRIAALTKEQRREAAHSVARKLAALGWHGKRIMLYNALPDEVDLTEAAKLLGEDNELFYPAVVGDDMYAVPEGELHAGAFGILEPHGAQLTASEAALDIVVVPLRAFDAECIRLGRGRGYYDRFFQGAAPSKVAVAFDQQRVDCVPTEAHDVPVDAVVTPSEIYRR